MIQELSGNLAPSLINTARLGRIYFSVVPGQTPMSPYPTFRSGELFLDSRPSEKTNESSKINIATTHSGPAPELKNRFSETESQLDEL